MRLDLSGGEGPYRDALEALSKDRAAARIWAEDASFWSAGKSGRESIAGALGWLTTAERLEPALSDLARFAEETGAGTDRVVVLGMGGSSLAPLVFADSFGRRPGFPHLEVLDSTHPSAVLEIAGAGDPKRTLFVVSSKSGSTLEPNIFFDYFYGLVERETGEGAGDRFAVITDPGSPLEKEARRRRVQRIFPGDPRIGGRYSALSNFGVVPAALAGVDVAEMLRRARKMATLCRGEGEDNPGLRLGAAIGSAALAGRDKLTFFTGAPVPRFGMWIEQLIAESTGKEGKGILPVEGEAPGLPEVYGKDRFFAVIRRAGREEEDWIAPLAKAGHPTARFEIEDALDLGAEMFRWEFATAVAGRLLGINPFDQPNVQEAKDRTNEILSKTPGVTSPGPKVEASLDGEALGRLLRSIRPGDYFAIMAYLPPSGEIEEKLNRLRSRVRDAKRVATTLGLGPRFLHSTGQLHKGGPGTGVFLQVTASAPSDAAIPGKPYSFGDVIAAQAAGDLSALKSRGRRALGVHLGDAVSGIDALESAVIRVLGGSGERKS